MVARRAALRPRRDDPPRRQGARRRDRRDPGAVRPAQPAVRAARSGRRRRARWRGSPGVAARPQGRRRLGHHPRARPPARRRSSSGWPPPIPPARVELRRPSLEDVFIGIVSAASAGGDDATLRAAVRDDGDGRAGAAAMKKILYVAQREFLATAGTKAFIFGILVTPLVIGVLILLIPWMSAPGPAGHRRHASRSSTRPARWPRGLAAYLEPARIEERRQRGLSAHPGGHAVRAALGQRHERPRGGGGSTGAGLDARQGAAAARSSALEPGTDVNAAKAALPQGRRPVRRRGRHASRWSSCTPTPCRRSPGRAASARYDLFVRAKLDDRVIDEIDDGVRDAIIGARVSQAGLDRAQIEDLTTVEQGVVEDRDGRGRGPDQRGPEPADPDGAHGPAAHVGADERAVPADDDHRGEVEPRRRGAAVGACRRWS